MLPFGSKYLEQIKLCGFTVIEPQKNDSPMAIG